MSRNALGLIATVGPTLMRCMIFGVPAPAFADHFFIHQSNAANSFAHMTFLDSPSANNASSAFIFVTPDLTNAHADNHPIGVYYEGTRRRWAIYNQDAAPMPAGARFHVAVFRDSGPGITWISADGNHGNSAPFSRPLSDAHPDALIIATSVNGRPEDMPGVEKFADLLAHADSGAYEEDPVTGLGTLYLAMRGRGVVRLDGVF